MGSFAYVLRSVISCKPLTPVAPAGSLLGSYEVLPGPPIFLVTLAGGRVLAPTPRTNNPARNRHHKSNHAKDGAANPIPVDPGTPRT